MMPQEIAAIISTLIVTSDVKGIENQHSDTIILVNEYMYISITEPMEPGCDD
jgi:hypothetical protein